MKKKMIALAFLLAAACTAAPQADTGSSSRTAEERKRQADFLDMRLRNAVRKRDESMAQLMRLRAELLKKDPELRKKYESIMRLYSEIAVAMEQKKEVRSLTEVISHLDADIQEMQKQKELQR